MAVLWPLNRLGSVDVPDVFATIPAPEAAR
jgi:hypothetical protein